jgi:hypothetical protein
MGGPRAFYIVPFLFYHLRRERARTFRGDSTLRDKPQPDPQQTVDGENGALEIT